MNGDDACNRTALPENGTEPEDPDEDRSVKAIGLPLYLEIFNKTPMFKMWQLFSLPSTQHITTSYKRLDMPLDYYMTKRFNLKSQVLA